LQPKVCYFLILQGELKFKKKQKKTKKEGKIINYLHATPWYSYQILTRKDKSQTTRGISTFVLKTKIHVNKQGNK